MAFGLRVSTAQPLPAARAPLGLQINDVRDLLGRHELTRLPLVAGLAAQPLNGYRLRHNVR